MARKLANASRKPLVTELCNTDRVSQIPEGFDLAVTPPKGYHGLCVGRERELRAIHGYFATQYRAEEDGLLQEDDCVACIITNAPGCGKTTLREKFMMEAMEKHIGCIELSTGQLMNPQEFIIAIINYAAAEPKRTEKGKPAGRRPIRKKLEELGRKLKKRKAGLAAAIVGTASEVAMPFSGTAAGYLTKELLTKKDDLAEKLVYELETSNLGLTVIRAMQLLSESHNGDYLLTVDEAHVWADPELDRSGLHTMLSILCNPSARKINEIKGGGLLISGLGNVKDNLDGLGLSRAEIIWVGELSDTETREIIRHSIEQIPKKRLGGDRRARILDSWPQTLAETFTAWPQHAAVAGQIAKRLILQTKDANESADATHLQWVITRTAEKISALYTTQLSSAEEDGDPNAPKAILTLATLNDGVLERKTVRRILEISRGERGLAIEPRDINLCLSIMKRAGIIRDHRVRLVAGGYRDEYRVGMPSLTNYTMATATKEEKKDAKKLVSAALRNG